MVASDAGTAGARDDGLFRGVNFVKVDGIGKEGSFRYCFAYVLEEVFDDVVIVAKRQLKWY